ncbi:MAG: malto-oligosyltrehalose trehalohydrolase [Acidobacteria bacterium]|nr:malto-oligosyltrehalose trehalohydrolase [Acidobacteriota bacterium]
MQRRYPIGAELSREGGANFRVWAPRRKHVSVALNIGSHKEQVVPLQREPGGYFSGEIPDAIPGTDYLFQLDDAGRFPDPASRFQPQGPHGPSIVVDPTLFEWTDHRWKGVILPGQVIYEFHVGTFTAEGTWEAARRELPELAAAGITVLEMMPVAEFPGAFGWGYDGVDLYAPTRLYGSPDDLRHFVDSAHGAGIAVILDAVYNHVGPDGNYLKEFSEDYFSTKYENEWGEAINFDGENSGPVREFFSYNAAYWVDEFHMDGLRLDATQQIFDSSPENIIRELTRRAREAARDRSIIVIGENERQDSILMRCPQQGGYGLDALWNDDFHHSALAALTGRNEAYYSDYRGSPQEFISAVKHGYLYQGQQSKWQKNKPRGTPAWGLEPRQFVTFLENHDQVANSAHGYRLTKLTDAGRLRAMTALLLLGPGTPMLFQGQEFASSTPFLFFADHCEDLCDKVREGRAEFLSQFRSLANEQMRRVLADPSASSTFQSCKLDWSERQRNQHSYDLHKDLLRLRREDPIFRLQGSRGIDGAVLGPEAFVLRFFGEGSDRLLLINFGLDLHLEIAPEPLLAPLENMQWAMLWCSEHPRYGGTGVSPYETEENWRLPGHGAVVMECIPAEERNSG